MSLDKYDERLVLLAKECSEVTFVVCKILRYGAGAHCPITKETNILALIREITDLYAAVELFDENLVPTRGAIDEAKRRKINQLRYAVGVPTTW